MNSSLWKIRCSLNPKAQVVNKAQRQLRPEPYFSEFFKPRALEGLKMSVSLPSVRPGLIKHLCYTDPRCPKINLALGVLGTEWTIFVYFYNEGAFEKLHISVISRCIFLLHSPLEFEYTSFWFPPFQKKKNYLKLFLSIGRQALDKVHIWLRRLPYSSFGF